MGINEDVHKKGAVSTRHPELGYVMGDGFVRPGRMTGARSFYERPDTRANES